jgi:pSer/pThr/pTyr-binding forkhead associated (FHA) protein
MYVLEVMSGPLDGKSWTFDREITIGRDDAVATACITIDRYISRKHAKLCADAGGLLRLVDLQSRNGTKVDGHPVVDETTLEVGKPFVVGRTTLRVVKE